MENLHDNNNRPNDKNKNKSKNKNTVKGNKYLDTVSYFTSSPHTYALHVLSFDFVLINMNKKHVFIKISRDMYIKKQTDREKVLSH